MKDTRRSRSPRPSALGSKAMCKPKRRRSRTPLVRRPATQAKDEQSEEYDPFTEQPAEAETAMTDEYLRSLEEMEDAVEPMPRSRTKSPEVPQADSASVAPTVLEDPSQLAEASDGDTDHACVSRLAEAPAPAEPVAPEGPQAPWRGEQLPVGPPDEAVPASRLRPAEPAHPPPQKGKGFVAGKGKGKGYGKQHNRPSQDRMGWANRAVCLLAAWDRSDWREMHRLSLQHSDLVQSSFAFF